MNSNFIIENERRISKTRRIEARETTSIRLDRRFIEGHAKEPIHKRNRVDVREVSDVAEDSPTGRYAFSTGEHQRGPYQENKDAGVLSERRASQVR